MHTPVALVTNDWSPIIGRNLISIATFAFCALRMDPDSFLFVPVYSE